MCLCAASYYHYKSEDGRESSATRPSSAGSMQVYTPSTLNRTTASNSPSNNVAIKSGERRRGFWDHSPIGVQRTQHCRVFLFADSLLFNRIDERLRLARERRGELEKQNGAYSCPFCHISRLNLLGSCGEVPICYIKSWHPPVAMALGLRNRSGIGTLFRKASSLACDFVCVVCDPVWLHSWSLLCFSAELNPGHLI